MYTRTHTRHTRHAHTQAHINITSAGVKHNLFVVFGKYLFGRVKIEYGVIRLINFPFIYLVAQGLFRFESLSTQIIHKLYLNIE